MIDLISAGIPYVFAFLVIYGALSDLSTFRIPNWVPYGLVLLFAAKVLLSWLDAPLLPNLGSGSPSTLLMLGFALLIFVIAVAFWKFGLIGGGDVKYLTAIALFMGPSLGLRFVLLLTVLAIGLAGVVYLLGRWAPALESGRSPAFVKRLVSNVTRGKLPYGFPIGVAALILVPRIFSF